MSLLAEAMKNCVMVDSTSVPDGYGGIDYVYVDGAPFDAAFDYDTSMQARVAGTQGTVSLYTITTSRNVNLQYHEIFKRLRDGKVFRVTSDGDDKYTPKSASLDMRQVSAEEYSLTNG